MKIRLQSPKPYCLIALFLLLFPTLICAQSPQKMSFQGVIRDNANALVANSIIGMQISILQGSENGNAVYIETHTPTTNSNGLVTLEIGTGTVVAGDFINIDWANGPFYIKTETDVSGGTNYNISGTSELLSVPYALFALNSEPGPTGADGLSAYEVAVLAGFSGTEQEWLDSLVGPQGAEGPQGPQGPTGPTGTNGINGSDGLSAYQIAVLAGFNGTEQEWLDSLVGPQGVEGPQGPQGPTGPTGTNGVDGTDGLSAYQIAVLAGFNGTEQEWLDSLVGPQGAEGPQGPQGPTGPTGTNGVDGTDGLSAYQIAVLDGFNGTEQEWLESLVGPQGAEGPQGPQGPTGPTGTNGADGLSAYQIAVLAGFNGTEQEWLDSLQGPAGAEGAQGTAGMDGISLNWLGSLGTAPLNPNINDAYYNSVAGMSYVWDGAAWQILAKDGTDGTSGANTLNEAYNGAGNGGGRTITTNAGALQIINTSGNTTALSVTSDVANARVVDISNSGTGLGIVSRNTNAANTSPALQVETNSSNGSSSAVFAQHVGAGYAISAQTTPSATGTAAIYGNSQRTNGGTGVLGSGFKGVEGQTTNGNGFGVYGTNTGAGLGIGIYGNGFNGVYGQTTDVTNGYAGYFTADLGVEGTGYSLGGWVVASDRRLKSNIIPINNALGQLQKLEGKHYTISYSLKDQDGSTKKIARQEYGLIAQDIEAVFPEMVKEKALFKNTGDNTLYKTVNYSELIPVLVEAVKDLKEQLEETKKELEATKKEIRELKN